MYFLKAEMLNEYFYFCIDQSQKHYDEIAQNIPEELGFIPIIL